MGTRIGEEVTSGRRFPGTLIFELGKVGTVIFRFCMLTWCFAMERIADDDGKLSRPRVVAQTDETRHRDDLVLERGD